MKLILILISLSLLSALKANAQSAQEVQDKIHYYVHNIDDDEKYDSLELTNKHFLEYLTVACTNNNQILEANFKLPKYSGLNIITSDDGLFRIYCWDTREGGTMRAYNGFIQFKDGQNIGVKILNDVSVRDEEHGRFDYGAYYKSIYTVKRKDNSIIYLVVSGLPLGGAYISATIHAFVLKNGKVIDTAKIFKTNKKSFNRIDIDYLTSANDEKMIYLNEAHTKLFIPLINKLNFTGKYLIYVFDGNNYVFDKNLK